MNTLREKIGWGRVPRVEDYFRMSRPVSKPVKLCAFMRTNIKSFLLQMVHLLAVYKKIFSPLPNFHGRGEHILMNLVFTSSFWMEREASNE